MKKYIYLLLLLIPIIIFSIVYFEKKSYSDKSKIIIINNHQISVEIANSDILREKGLSGRENLSQDAGMLFIFPSSGYHYFWMKDMEFPLDFIWVNDKTVVDLTENVLNDWENNPLNNFSSKMPADKVIELNTGAIKLLNISIGDKIAL